MERSRVILGQDFFARSSLRVARDLIGKFLVRREDGKTTAHMIVETEAYVGPHDLACHASKGLTPRTKIMFGPAGYFYVYFTYGMHWLINVVTDREGYPSAVLLRGLADVTGPARLTKKLGITGAMNGKPAKRSSGLWIEDRKVRVPPRRIIRTPRIGVDYAGEVWAAKPYRFVVNARELDIGRWAL